VVVGGGGGGKMKGWREVEWSKSQSRSRKVRGELQEGAVANETEPGEGGGPRAHGTLGYR